MKVRGKRDRTASVLIKPNIEKCLQLILSHRKEGNVPNNNKYLFGLPSLAGLRIRVIDACRVVLKFSGKCGAKDPKSLRGKTMRKHMASMCISKELSDNAVSDVADVMGHHEKIHREYYRRNPMVREVVKMSQLLEAAQGNCDGEMRDCDDTVQESGDEEMSDRVILYGKMMTKK